MEYSNTLTGILSRNDRKRPDKKDPDFQGSCEMEDGKQYWISGWVKESGPNSKTPGRKFFSLAFKAKDVPKTSEPTAPAPKAQEKLDEDVPF